jgi:hypothetical protein
MKLPKTHTEPRLAPYEMSMRLACRNPADMPPRLDRLYRDLFRLADKHKLAFSFFYDRHAHLKALARLHERR